MGLYLPHFITPSFSIYCRFPELKLEFFLGIFLFKHPPFPTYIQKYTNALCFFLWTSQYLFNEV